LEDNIILQATDIYSGYGKMEILHGVSLYLWASEVVSVIGSNGAGKSTAFKTIMGYLHPTQGKVDFNGKEITGLRPNQILRKGLAYVPQGRIVFPQMAVLENLQMGAFILKDKRKEQDALERVYRLFPVLKERRSQRAGSLSGGEQQMLAMGRGLMTGPKVLLLDEPSLGLAPKFVSMVFEKVLEMKSQGFTLMIVEQNAARALEVADRGYVLELGCNRFEGTGENLLNNPEVRRLYLGG
jgi:ABC-type branched-subunit amino acid transport system ATPase component